MVPEGKPRPLAHLRKLVIVVKRANVRTVVDEAHTIVHHPQIVRVDVAAYDALLPTLDEQVHQAKPVSSSVRLAGLEGICQHGIAPLLVERQERIETASVLPCANQGTQIVHCGAELPRFPIIEHLVDVLAVGEGDAFATTPQWGERAARVGQPIGDRFRVGDALLLETVRDVGDLSEPCSMTFNFHRQPGKERFDLGILYLCNGLFDFGKHIAGIGLVQPIAERTQAVSCTLILVVPPPDRIAVCQVTQYAGETTYAEEGQPKCRQSFSQEFPYATDESSDRTRRPALQAQLIGTGEDFRDRIERGKEGITAHVIHDRPRLGRRGQCRTDPAATRAAP